MIISVGCDLPTATDKLTLQGQCNVFEYNASVLGKGKKVPFIVLR